MDNRELTLTDLLADPMIRAVMAADQVDPAALEAALSRLPRRLEPAWPAAGLKFRLNFAAMDLVPIYHQRAQ